MLEERGIITGYGARVDRQALGLGLTIFVEVGVARHSRENAAGVQERLLQLPGCVSCHMVSGDADFLIEMAVENLGRYEAILTEHLLSMPEISTVRSNFSLRSLRVGGVLDVPPAAKPD